MLLLSFAVSGGSSPLQNWFSCPKHALSFFSSSQPSTHHLRMTSSEQRGKNSHKSTARFSVAAFLGLCLTPLQCALARFQTAVADFPVSGILGNNHYPPYWSHCVCALLHCSSSGNAAVKHIDPICRNPTVVLVSVLYAARAMLHHLLPYLMVHAPKVLFVLSLLV